MTTRSTYTILLLAVLLFTACRKDDIPPADCAKLQQAILTGNPDETEAEINRICDSLGVTANTEDGLTKLVKAISNQCKLSASIVCFECIKTLPVESEIKITVQSSAGYKEKIIDITRSGDNFTFAGMHD